jgi:hypothetical protein
MFMQAIAVRACASPKHGGRVDNRALEPRAEGMFPSYRQGNRSVFARRHRPSLTWWQSEATE